MNKNKIFIIIVTFNGIKWIDKCLKSCGNYPVIIVDNNSTDNTISFVNENYPLITILPQTSNLGFGKANNLGISYALNQGAEYVFLLNQDAYLDHKTIENVFSIHKENPEYGILSPIHINASKDKLDKNFSNYISFNNNPSFISDLILKRNLFKVYSFPFVNAAAWLISKECLLNVGGFDPIFFHYGEDNNYCQRVIYHGYKIGVVANSTVVHDREFREKVTLKNTDKKNLKNKETAFKIKLANINNLNNIKVYKTELKKLNTKTLKSLIKFNRREYEYFNILKRVLKKSFLESKKSMSVNKTKGNHYLKILNK
ncbi:glycosyltransferase family 2 protein [Tenacibaculum aquimarinum]|uniref:glycosyltransferase family 2 protein n=1 Tax=Tenacibaculum aquimarinum TaxID=2910675 RepID=UPI001F0A9468|nr:glycosyltransferase family 2 protein [Tenacibaculum aquimarinum]MCH3884981.1 glycosyltransferase family 2 protein [Tenacibaculum aquimarinum]